MKVSWFILSFLTLALVTACQGPQAMTGTPSPAPTIAGPPIRPNPVALITLARNPASFANQVIQVSGNYAPEPLLVCAGETHRSPATWSLTAPDLEVPAGGLDSALRELSQPGQSLIVEGRWLHWSGLVGCGRRPPVQEIWYLDVSRIISPNPLALAISTPEEVAAVGSPTAGPTSPPTPSLPGPSPALTAVGSPTPLFSPYPGPPLEGSPTIQVPLGTPTRLMSPTPIGQATLTGTAAGTVTISPTASGTITGTVTVTATVSPSPSASVTSGATPVPTDKGSLAYDDLVKDTLEANTAHSWQFNGQTGTSTTISVVGSPGLSLKLELINPQDTVMVTQNSPGAGQPATISQVSLPELGAYRLLISAAGGTSGDYAVTVLNDLSEPFYILQPAISYGFSGSGDLPAGIDHVYHFEAAGGDRVSIVVGSGGTGDILFYLWAPDGFEVEFVDENGAGQGEELRDYELTAAGFFTVGIGEADFEAANYSFTLNKDN